MSQSRIGTGLALAGAMSLLAVGAALAQPPNPTGFWISFPTGSTELHTADHETISGVAAYMKRNPALVASIVGKTDTVGSAEFNEQLSKQRATAVFEDLVYKNGISATRVGLQWSGERLPNVPTADQQAELQNRVVVITVHSPVPGAMPVTQAELGMGQQIAMQVCVSCHVVVPDQAVKPVVQPAAPSFQAILAIPGMNAGFVTEHLLHTHYTIRTDKGMRNPELTEEQATAVADYVMSLKQ